MILRGLVLLAAIGWLLLAIGWGRVATVRSDDLRREAIRQVSFVMAFVCAVTAGAALASVW
jgi:hypothetical protein